MYGLFDHISGNFVSLLVFLSGYFSQLDFENWKRRTSNLIKPSPLLYNTITAGTSVLK
jgi:hypothetical protein